MSKNKSNNAGCIILPVSIITGLVSISLIEEELELSAAVGVWLCFFVCLATYFLLVKIWNMFES